MQNEYIIVNKTALLKMRKELKKEYANWDGKIYGSDYQRGQVDLIDAIISFQSTSLIPEIEKAFDAGKEGWYQEKQHSHGSYVSKFKGKIEHYISNLKLDV